MGGKTEAVELTQVTGGTELEGLHGGIAGEARRCGREIGGLAGYDSQAQAEVGEDGREWRIRGVGKLSGAVLTGAEKCLVEGGGRWSKKRRGVLRWESVEKRKPSGRVEDTVVFMLGQWVGQLGRFGAGEDAGKREGNGWKVQWVVGL